MPMVLDRLFQLRHQTLLRSALFLGLMGCGYVILAVGRPPRRPPAIGSDPLSEPAMRARITDGVTVAPGRWTSIVVHHSATASGNAARFHDYHLYERGWEGGLGYHFVIGNGDGSGDGEVEIGARWLLQETGVHVRLHNAGAIGICLVGNFEETAPTPTQMRALTCLVRCLMDLCRLDPGAVKLHRELGDTLCPGQFFPAEEFRTGLAAPAAD